MAIYSLEENKNVASVVIPSDSKTQYAKGEVITLYNNSFSVSQGYYTIPPHCIIESKNKERYSVETVNVKNSNGNIVQTSITIKYTVHKENVLPKHTGDRAIINYKVSDTVVNKLRIFNFDVDTSYATTSEERKGIVITGDPGAKLEVVVKDAEGTIIKRFNNLVVPKGKTGQSQGVIKTNVSIPSSTSATTYTVEAFEGENTTFADNVKTLHTINQYAAAGINVSISSTTSTSLVVTGTTPVASNGLEVGTDPSTTSSMVANWVISKSGPTKIYAHRPPVLSQVIAYNTNGSSDYTNTVISDNGNTQLYLSNTSVVQTSNTAVTLALTHRISNVGTANVSPVLNLDNFISTKPPSFDAGARVVLGGSVLLKLDSAYNKVPVSATYMTGGWSTVSAPSIGSLGSYGAYNGGTPGAVTYTAPSDAAYEAAGSPNQITFTYKVNDGTTDSDNATVTITFSS